jgi:hypothetical protein
MFHMEDFFDGIIFSKGDADLEKADFVYRGTVVLELVRKEDFC